MTTPPIGVFDSGVGGLTVLKAIAQSLPHESIIYFGDTARLPYGDKSPQTIEKYTQEGVNFLVNNSVKLVVLACNTASAYAANKLRNHLPVPLVDVIGPSASTACVLTKNKRIAVLGTHATIRSSCYPHAIQQLIPDATITAIACPLFVPLVEEGLIHHPATELLVKEYLQPVIHNDCDTVILGCTHYPLLKAIIKNHLPQHIQIVDSASCCAEAVCQWLKDTNAPSQGHHSFFVTDDSERFRTIAAQLLERPLQPHQVELLHV